MGAQPTGPSSRRSGMIGVAVPANERAIAAEFFELLKTPWEFCRREGRYDVVLCTSENLPCAAPQLLLIFRGEATSFDANHRVQVNSRRTGGFVVSHEGKRLPIYGSMATFSVGANPVLREETTQEPAAFASRIGQSTTVRVGYNLFEEIRSLLTDGQPSANASIPTLDEHIQIVRDWIARAGIPLVEIPPVPDGFSFIACLTHDIDHPRLRNHWCDHTMFGFIYRSTIGILLQVLSGRKPVRSLMRNWNAACLLPFVHLGIAKDAWSGFDRYLELDGGHGSTFFVIPRPNCPGRTSEGPAPPMRACRYNVDELLPQLKRIVSAGGEVGVHGLNAWLDADEGRKERARISQAVGATELGARMHWLFFNGGSPARLDSAGFSYDSTVGYRETIGFRTGTTQAYKPPGVNRLLELPLHVMDTSLFYPSYLNLRDEEAKRLTGRVLNDVERIGGTFTVNWHDRSIAPDRLWDTFYLDLVRELQRRRAWFATGSKAVAWFRKRRAAGTRHYSNGQGNDENPRCDRGGRLAARPQNSHSQAPHTTSRRAPCTGSTRPICRHALQEFDGTQFCIMNVNGTVLAQLGCGYWGPNLLRNFSSLTNCRVKYVVDSSPERRAFVEANFPRTTAVDSYDAVLADPEVSGVLIATPAGTHFRLAKQALLAGKNVFVEKPLATKVAEVDELDQLAAERSLLVMAGHTFLYNEAVRYVKRLLDAGELGQVRYIYSQRLNLGRIRPDIDALWNFAPHDISIIQVLARRPGAIISPSSRNGFHPRGHR